MTNVVSIKELSKRFGRIQALNKVSFDIPSNSIFGLLGPNGAGKTTLFSIIADFLKADAGTVEVLGIDTRYISRLQGRLSILPQDAQFQRNVPILDQLVFFRLLAGRTKKQAREEVIHSLELVGLKSVAKRRVSSLSHGMVKRLGIAQAFLGHPEVILLDEPTAGVDPVSRREFWELLYMLAEDGVTVFVTTHYMDEAEHCHRLAFIQRGELIAVGSPKKLKESMMEGRVIQISPSDTARTIELLRKASETDELQLGGITLYGSFVHVVVPKDGPAESNIEEYLKGAELELHMIREIEPSLEDVFIACMD